MSLPYPAAPAQSESRSVLAIPAFRKLWQAMAFSSFGDWLGLLASTALAQQLAGGDYAKANFAIAGVFIVRLLPAVILGPFAGVIADKFDRRKLMIICDILRFSLYLSIPIVGNYFWLYTASVLAEVVTLFWSPAKEATVPNLAQACSPPGQDSLLPSLVKPHNKQHQPIRIFLSFRTRGVVAFLLVEKATTMVVAFVCKPAKIIEL